jgi:L-asparaginase / beta-aspartyl-peptidase
LTWSAIVHGGAKDIKPRDREPNREGCLAALAAAQGVLERGGSAIEAVCAAVKVFEDNPTFNAGKGSEPNEEGDIEMCAALMEGDQLKVGAVAAIRGVRNPVCVAAAMLDEEPILLVAEGARAFAQRKGAELCTTEDLKAQRAPAEGRHETVGCVALDQDGNLSVATSTGGLGGSPPGRVGDSPQPGCGFYADNFMGAVAYSGDGEQIARLTLASRTMRHLEIEDPVAAVRKALAALDRTGGEAGGIAMDKAGRIGWAHVSPHFAVAWATSDEPTARVCLSQNEVSS